jgi:hypothetical protein
MDPAVGGFEQGGTFGPVNLAQSLHGGSGGGGGEIYVGYNAWMNTSGGTGGGSIEMGTSGSIVISGSAEIDAEGTPGEYPAGGGSGGGVFLHADSVSVTGQAVLDLAGGGYGFGAGGSGEVVAMGNSLQSFGWLYREGCHHHGLPPRAVEPRPADLDAAGRGVLCLAATNRRGTSPIG